MITQEETLKSWEEEEAHLASLVAKLWKLAAIHAHPDKYPKGVWITVESLEKLVAKLEGERK